jgi:hypothetical protein
MIIGCVRFRIVRRPYYRFEMRTLRNQCELSGMMVVAFP